VKRALINLIGLQNALLLNHLFHLKVLRRELVGSGLAGLHGLDAIEVEHFHLGEVDQSSHCILVTVIDKHAIRYDKTPSLEKNTSQSQSQSQSQGEEGIVSQHEQERDTWSICLHKSITVSSPILLDTHEPI
jgi:hypothetical protein